MMKWKITTSGICHDDDMICYAITYGILIIICLSLIRLSHLVSDIVIFHFIYRHFYINMVTVTAVIVIC